MYLHAHYHEFGPKNRILSSFLSMYSFSTVSWTRFTWYACRSWAIFSGTPGLQNDVYGLLRRGGYISTYFLMQSSMVTPSCAAALRVRGESKFITCLTRLSPKVSI